jgi:tetratricopeptide (TPR) repeat protein
MGFRRYASRGTGFKRKRVLKKTLFGAVILVFLLLMPSIYNKFIGQNLAARRQLRDYFETGAFEAAYTQSALMLIEKPLDPFLLTIHGFSAYQLAIAQINNLDTLSYMDDSIWSLRKALLSRENSNDGRVFYVLGKAYFYKGYGYADLSVKYLEKALAANFIAADIPEYLGLAYAAIGDYRNSVAAFSLALTGEREPSDVLLLAIARSYLALENFETARAYLVRSLEVSLDSRTISTARLVLGNTLLQIGDLEAAEAEYLRLLEEYGENAEAHFQLGELYALGGDMTRARAEWRRALRLDPTHGPARSRLN